MGVVTELLLLLKEKTLNDQYSTKKDNKRIMFKPGINSLVFCLTILRITSETNQATISPFYEEPSGGTAGIGCPRENNNQTVTSTPLEAAVRCCSVSGIDCITPGGPPSKHYGKCLETATFEEAEKKCASINMRLCTSDELKSNMCCRTGCGFDTKPTWHKREVKAFQDDQIQKYVAEIQALQDDKDKISTVQKYGVKTIKQLLAFIQETINVVDAKVKTSNIDLRNLKSETDSLDLEQFEHTKTFVEKFFDAKLNLLDIKRDLVSLTSKIILHCKNIEINIENWQDDYATILLKNQFKQLTRMIVGSKTMLESATEKFDSLIISDIIMKMDVFKQTLVKALNKQSMEYKRWTNNIKSYYASGQASFWERGYEEVKKIVKGDVSVSKGIKKIFKGDTKEEITLPITLGMIIADIFRCSGPCKGVFETSAWINSASTAEIAIKNYEERLTHFKNQIEIANSGLNELDKETRKVYKQTNQKVADISALLHEAENVKNIIKDLTPAQMKDILEFQDRFGNSIGDLKTAAQEFYKSASPKKPMEQMPGLN